MVYKLALIPIFEKIFDVFTGIIEQTGTVVATEKSGNNISYTIQCSFCNELKVDQSVAHNGVCLTVTHIDLERNTYKVTAINETLIRTNLADLDSGMLVNLERCLKLYSLLDGHLVQGHVDTVAICDSVMDDNGSWRFKFSYAKQNNPGYITVEKGSVTVNGVSLTVVDSGDDYFSVAIIPYTFEHTNFKAIKLGMKVNIEFDIIGKYVAKLATKAI